MYFLRVFDCNSKTLFLTIMVAQCLLWCVSGVVTMRQCFLPNTLIFLLFLCLPNVAPLTSTFVPPLPGIVSRVFFYLDVYLLQCVCIKSCQTIAVLSGELLYLLYYSCWFSVMKH